MADAGYNPARSKTKPDVLARFIGAPVSGDLTEIPGVGPATVELLRTHHITTTFQLFGKFLSLKDEGVESVGNSHQQEP